MLATPLCSAARLRWLPSAGMSFPSRFTSSVTATRYLRERHGLPISVMPPSRKAGPGGPDGRSTAYAAELAIVNPLTAIPLSLGSIPKYEVAHPHGPGAADPRGGPEERAIGTSAPHGRALLAHRCNPRSGRPNIWIAQLSPIRPRPVKWCKNDHLIIRKYQLAAASSEPVWLHPCPSV